MSAPRNPYIRIVEAAKKGRGVVLSPLECRLMSFDDAIATVAHNTAGGEICGTDGLFGISKERIYEIED